MKMRARAVMRLALVKSFFQNSRVFAASTIGPAEHGCRRPSTIIDTNEAVPECGGCDVFDLSLEPRRLFEDCMDRVCDMVEQDISVDLKTTVRSCCK